MSQDSLWKEAIEAYFEDLLAFFFPDIYRDINFEHGYEFLDKELAEIAHGGEVGLREADSLVKVWLKDDSERWLIIHIEVQGYFDLNFARRMFIYNYRTFDRYGVDVVSLAILADNDPQYRPQRFEVAHWGFRCFFEYPMVKLLDFLPQRAELETNANPFAVLVGAYLKAWETRREVSERFSGKMALIKTLYERGYSRENVELLYRFIDELLALPPDLAQQFHRELVQYEEAKKMAYVTTAERIGIEKGIQQGILQGLQQGISQGRSQGREEGVREGLLRAIRLGLKNKFKGDGLRLYPAISRIEDVSMLEAISEVITITGNLEDVEQVYRQI